MVIDPNESKVTELNELEWIVKVIPCPEKCSRERCKGTNCLFVRGKQRIPRRRIKESSAIEMISSNQKLKKKLVTLCDLDVSEEGVETFDA